MHLSLQGCLASSGLPVSSQTPILPLPVRKQENVIFTLKILYTTSSSLPVWNISFVLNLPFSRVVLSPLVIVYLLKESSFSVGSGCCFFYLKGTPFPCRQPFPWEDASPSQFPTPVGRSVSMWRMASRCPNIISTSWPSNQFFLWDAPRPEQILTHYFVLLCSESEQPPCLSRDRQLILVPAWWEA